MSWESSKTLKVFVFIKSIYVPQKALGDKTKHAKENLEIPLHSEDIISPFWIIICDVDMIFSVHWLLFPSIQKTDISLFLPTRIWFSFILRLVIQVPLIPVDCSCIWSFSTSKSSKKRSYRNSSKPDGIVALRSPFTLRIIEPLGSFAQKVIVIFKNFKKLFQG